MTSVPPYFQMGVSPPPGIYCGVLLMHNKVTAEFVSSHNILFLSQIVTYLREQVSVWGDKTLDSNSIRENVIMNI